MINWTVLEILGTLVGLVYLYLEYRASIWLWLTGIIMPAIYIFVYLHSGFYADMAINVYYLGAGLYGWLVWMGRGEKKDTLPITRTPRRYWLPLAGVFALFFIVIVFVLINFTDSTVPFGDGFTTALSVVALWMLSRKYVEQWLVWLVVDVVCAALYLYKGLHPTAGLYALYSVISVFGYYKWKRLMTRHEQSQRDADSANGV